MQLSTLCENLENPSTPNVTTRWAGTCPTRTRRRRARGKKSSMMDGKTCRRGAYYGERRRQLGVKIEVY